MTIKCITSLLIVATIFFSPLNASISSSHAGLLAQQEIPIEMIPEETPQNLKEKVTSSPSSDQSDQPSSEEDLAYKARLNRFLTTGFIVINAILFGVGLGVVKANQGAKVTSDSH